MMISIAGREINEVADPAEALLKRAHERKVRPLCLCRKPPPQLQIAHIGEHYFVKRLPRDAGAHALHCERFEIPLSLSGKVASAGKSIIDDQRNDGVEIKLAVALQPRKARRAGDDRRASLEHGQGRPFPAQPVRPPQLPLGRGQPLRVGAAIQGTPFLGCRVDRLNAALPGKSSKTFGYEHIAYIPAAFDASHPDVNGRARLAKTHRAIADRHRMVFIGEFKELTQGKFGPILKLKHIDCAITVADYLKRRMLSRFRAEFALCDAKAHVRLIACCLVDFNKAGYPTLAEIGFLTVSPEWLPFSSEAEAMLIQALVGTERSFTKTLRYDLRDDAVIASADAQGRQSGGHSAVSGRRIERRRLAAGASGLISDAGVGSGTFLSRCRPCRKRGHGRVGQSLFRKEPRSPPRRVRPRRKRSSSHSHFPRTAARRFFARLVGRRRGWTAVAGAAGQRQVPSCAASFVTALSIQGWQGHPFGACRPELGNGQGQDQLLGDDVLDSTLRVSGVVGGAGSGLSRA